MGDDSAVTRMRVLRNERFFLVLNLRWGRQLGRLRRHDGPDHWPGSPLRHHCPARRPHRRLRTKKKSFVPKDTHAGDGGVGRLSRWPKLVSVVWHGAMLYSAVSTGLAVLNRFAMR